MINVVQNTGSDCIVLDTQILALRNMREIVFFMLLVLVWPGSSESDAKDKRPMMAHGYII